MRFIKVDEDEWVNVDWIQEIKLFRQKESWCVQVRFVGNEFEDLREFKFTSESTGRDKLNALLSQVRK